MNFIRTAMTAALAGTLVASSFAAKSPLKPKVHSTEDAVWGSSAKKAHSKSPKTKQTNTTEGGATVTFNPKATGNPKPTGSPSPTKKPDPKRPVVSTPSDPQALPGVPADFGTESEARGFQREADDALAQIGSLLSGAYKKKIQVKPGLEGVTALQPEIEKALADEDLADSTRQGIKAELGRRDSALYMYAASLLTRKKDDAAAKYLRFLAKSAQPGTPMRDAAAQELRQLGRSL